MDGVEKKEEEGRSEQKEKKITGSGFVSCTLFCVC